MCCGQPWKWHLFWKLTCNGLCRLQVICGFCLNIKVVSNVSLTLCQTHCKQVPPFQKWLDNVGKFMLTHIASLKLLPKGQYGSICFGYCFSGPLLLRSQKEQVTFLGPFLGVPSHFTLHQVNWQAEFSLAECIMPDILKISCEEK